MNGFLRPEALALLTRWREVIIGAAVATLSGWVALTAIGVLRALAFGGMAIGAVLVWEGLRRARLPKDGGGAGMVEIDERQITYFAPDGGGAISVEALTRIEARSSGKGRFLWVFQDENAQVLAIPGNAEGAAQIFDALSVLKGFDYEDVIETATFNQKAIRVLWEKSPARLH